MSEQTPQPDFSPETKSSGKPYIQVWDLPVRIFHWLLVITLAAAFVTNQLGPTYFKYHVWSGYAMIVMVIFRIIWGFVGSYHARFFKFVRGPISTTRYALSFLRGGAKQYAGHNPLGAVMVVIMLIALLVQAVTGLFGNDEIFNLGPLYAYVSSDLSLQLTSVHRQLFYWILGAVVLHVLAVLFHVFFKRDNIIKAMFTGKKALKDFYDATSIRSSRSWLAIVLVVVIGSGLAWVISTAPEAVSDFG